MQLHQLRSTYERKKKKRVGRGGKRGTYSGRGLKGQKSRAGRRFKPVVRELIKRYPKLRGYKFKSKAKAVAVLNVDVLEKKFSPGDKITPAILVQNKIIRRIKGGVPQVKILGKGEITKSFIIKGCLISKQAGEKIEKAGGNIMK